MWSTRLQSITKRISASSLGGSMRRFSGGSYTSQASNTSGMETARAINTIIYRARSVEEFEEEKERFGSELSLLEPRPTTHWLGVEERMI